MIAIDAAWLCTHPLPALHDDTDKNERGRVLAVGGSRLVPGALRLTGEAVLRAGAGKLQMATIAPAALMLGMAMPEAAVIALPEAEDGEIDGAAARAALDDAIGRCDAVVIGPGMSGADGCVALVEHVLGLIGPDGAAVLDAAAIGACRTCADAVRRCRGAVVLTPHRGEFAALTGHDADWIADHAEQAARDVARDLRATLVLKGGSTWVASPDDEPLCYPGGGPELATGGSGDVLAGVLAALLARRAGAMTAAGWAVWAHGEAGRERTSALGGAGLLARDLPELLPRLLARSG